jgi:hypothetical protein
MATRKKNLRKKKKASVKPAKGSRFTARVQKSGIRGKREKAAGKSHTQPVEIRAESQLVVVKFRDNKEIPYTDGWEDKPPLIPREELEREFGPIKLRRVFTSVSPDRIRELVKRAEELNRKKGEAVNPKHAKALNPKKAKVSKKYRDPEFLTYFFLELTSPEAAARIVSRLRALETVEQAYLDVPTANAQGGGIASIHCTSPSAHANAGPTGVGTGCAAQFQGGDGAGLHFVDIEEGWNRGHDSLTMHNIPSPLAGIESDSDVACGHGTAVLGIVCGAGPLGQKGIAPNVDSVKVSSCVSVAPSTNEPGQNIADAILAAISDLELNTAAPQQADEGRCGLLLIERHLKIFEQQGGAAIHLPVEVFPVVFAAIDFAVFGHRITVVEAAGNGREQAGSAAGFDLNSIDLTSYTANGEPVFMPSALEVDSGAIIVGGVRATVNASGHDRLGASNFGSRVDCYAWGEGVVAACTQRKANSSLFTDNECIQSFGGTSSAAAIIAGVALVVQGMIAKANGGAVVLPAKLRAGLKKPTIGTPVFDLAPGRAQIGFMPDLCKALAPNTAKFATIFGVAPVLLAS